MERSARVVGAVADLAAAVRTALPHLRHLELTGRIGVEAFSRTLVPAAVADALAIWRAPHHDGLGLAERALHLVRAVADRLDAPSQQS